MPGPWGPRPRWTECGTLTTPTDQAGSPLSACREQPERQGGGPGPVRLGAGGRCPVPWTACLPSGPSPQEAGFGVPMPTCSWPPHSGYRARTEGGCSVGHTVQVGTASGRQPGLRSVGSPRVCLGAPGLSQQLAATPPTPPPPRRPPPAAAPARQVRPPAPCAGGEDQALPAAAGEAGDHPAASPRDTVPCFQRGLRVPQFLWGLFPALGRRPTLAPGGPRREAAGAGRQGRALVPGLVCVGSCQGWEPGGGIYLWGPLAHRLHCTHTGIWGSLQHPPKQWHALS